MKVPTSPVVRVPKAEPIVSMEKKFPRSDSLRFWLVMLIIEGKYTPCTAPFRIRTETMKGIDKLGTSEDISMILGIAIVIIDQAILERKMTREPPYLSEKYPPAI